MPSHSPVSQEIPSNVPSGSLSSQERGCCAGKEAQCHQGTASVEKSLKKNEAPSTDCVRQIQKKLKEQKNI